MHGREAGDALITLWPSCKFRITCLSRYVLNPEITTLLMCMVEAESSLLGGVHAQSQRFHAL